MLASVYDVPLAERKSRPVAELMTIASDKVTDGAPADRFEPPEELRKGRTRIWDLNASLHCSIIGTCLSAGELRRLLIRLKVAGAETTGDHDLHMLGVLLAARPKEGAKLLQKTLDRRHDLAINRFAKAKDAAAACALWEEAMARGEIPGAYWALLTHPLTTDQMVRHAFGDVHMISHLVGATNRADIRRLRQLEDDNATLVDKLERQQVQLHDGFIERDKAIQHLTALLERRIAEERLSPAGGQDDLADLVRDLERKLDEEIARRQSVEDKLSHLSEALAQSEAAQWHSERERNLLREELASIEGQVDAMLRPDDDAELAMLDLAGTTVLYVGGRAKQVAQLRALVERLNGHFLHHDGGLEQSTTLLPGLISRADVAFFPVDCVSHDAMSAVKRMCDQAARPYVPLRTSGLTCLLSALTTLAQQRQPEEFVAALQ
jgi:hypothetical protein